MDLYFIKLFTLTTIFLCCIIATYTDIKWGIIPNYLTFSMIILGLGIITYYFYITSNFKIDYYFAVLCIFIFSYVLWHFGLWAGGDVKLITGISTMLIPDFLNYANTGFVDYLIPIFYVMINSLFSVLPIIILIVLYEIIKNKRHLTSKLYSSFNIYETLFNLNILFTLNVILGMMNIGVLIKWVVICITLYLANNKIGKNKKLIQITTILIILTITCTTFHMIKSYIITFIVLEFITLTFNFIKNGTISEILTSNYSINNLDEGMLLAKPLVSYENTYTFKKVDEYGSIIIKPNIYGLKKDEIQLLEKLKHENHISMVPIKKTICFAPFIFAGVILTIFLGNIITVIPIVFGVLP